VSDAQDGKITELLEQGLQLYGLGEPHRALEIWQRVLEIDPKNLRASEYIKFVGEGLAEDTSGAALAPAAEVSSTSGQLEAPPAQAPEGSADADGSGALAVVQGEAIPPPPAVGEPQAVEPPAVEPPAAELQAADAEAVALNQNQDQPGASAATATAPVEDVPVEDVPVEGPEATASVAEVSGPAAGVLAFSWGDLIAPSEPAPAEPVPVEPVPAEPAPEAIEVEPPAGAVTQETEDPWADGPSVATPVTLHTPQGAGDEFPLPISGEHASEPVVAVDTSTEDHPQADATAAAPGNSASAGADGGERTVAQECELLMQGARDLFQLGDFSDSLELVEKVLTLDSANSEARDYLERNQETLLKMYESKIGSFQCSPSVVIPPDEIIWLNLHHRAGFLLSQIDGNVSYEDLLALSGMSKLETCKILVQLLREGVIASV